MKRGDIVKKWFKAVIGAVVFLIVLFCAATFYTKYLEVREIGAEYTKVFFTDIFSKIEMFAVCLVVTFAILLATLFTVRKNVARLNDEVPKILKRKYVFLASALGAIISAAVFSGDMYEKFLLFRKSVPSGITEPVFGKDISYFFFTREFLQSSANALMSILSAALIVSLVLYAAVLVGADREKAFKIIKEPGVFAHWILIILSMFVLKGVMYYFDAQGVLLSQDGVTAGALYTDVKIRLPFYSAAPFLLFATVIVAAIFLYKKRFKSSVVTILVFPALLFIMNVVSYAVEELYVAPNEVTLESEYIERNIEYTKIGFGIDNVLVRTFPAEQNLSYDALEKNSDIVNNIRITDPVSTLEVLNSTKSIRNYYVFNDSDIVSYDIDGQKRAVNIAAREMDVDKLPEGADNYINKTFRYTHGYGIVMNPVNAVTSEGQPECIISDMPITSTSGAPIITQPRIYYGEKTNNYCIVNTSINEFDYALNDENVEEDYHGTKSGIKMNFLNRLLFAVKNSDYTMLISGYINSDSKLLTNRNVRKRVKKAVPFMAVDNDPYIVADDDGKLFWIVDLYTYSDKMPYATNYNGISYIRNSAKAVVDAYEGTVEVYITDETDPIVMTYDNVYPSVMKKGGLPESLEEHIRYPEFIFDMQSQVYLRYHMSDAETFYANTDLWAFAKEKYRGNDSVDVQPYYNLLSVNDFGSDGAQLVLMQPLVPENKENLVAWLACDNEGNMISYRFPSGRTVYGTLHIENRIDADAAISKELSLWNQGGSSVLRGNLLVIPIEDSLIYVEPIYITTSNSAAVPEVKRIIVSYGDKVVMRETLEECFEELFGEGTEKIEDAPVDVSQAYDAVAAAIEAYDRAQSAMSSGSWTTFGSAMSDLGNAIDILRGEENADENTNENQ
jgi:hypothetical protein